MNQVCCDHCENWLHFPSELRGKKIKCPNCQQIVDLPAAADSATQPIQTHRPVSQAQPKPNLRKPTHPKASKVAPQTKPSPQPVATPVPQPATPSAPQTQPTSQPVLLKPVQLQPAPLQPVTNVYPQPQSQPLAPLSSNPNYASQVNQPNMLTPQPALHPVAYQPGYAQPLRRKGNGYGVALSLTLSAVGLTVVIIVVVLLMLQPGKQLSPEEVFYKARNALLDGDFMTVWDYSAQVKRDELDRGIDIMMANDPQKRLTELTLLKGRARVKRWWEIGKEMGIVRARPQFPKEFEDQLRTAKIERVEYNDDKTRVTLYVDNPLGENGKCEMVKESDGWKLVDPKLN